MKLHTLKPAKGSRRKRKIVGRGVGSTLGKTCGTGHNGQKSRSGGGKPSPFFEGGQMPLIRRLPKFGFTNIFRKEYAIVNLDTLSELGLEGEINADVLAKRGVIKAGMPLKVLGRGKLKNAISITANRFSRTAVEKIGKIGGKAVVV